MPITKPHKYKSFVFTHIPKCGGSSFRRYLFDSAIASNIDSSRIYAPGTNNIPEEKNLARLSTIKIEQLNNNNLILLADHTVFEGHKTLNISMQDTFYYTILRRPYFRFLSHYNFFYYKLGYSGCKGKRLNELPMRKVNNLVNDLANIQVRYILGIPLGSRVKLNNSHLEEAKFNIEHKFANYGILEKLTSSLQLLNQSKPHWLKFEKNFPVVNKNKLKAQPKQAIKKLFREENQIELNFFNFANKLYDKRVESYRKSVGKPVVDL